MNLKDNIWQMLEGRIPVQVQLGKVVSVDKDAMTCDVDMDGMTMYDVRLKSVIDNNDKAVMLFPKQDSSVLVGIINNNERHPFVVAYGEVDELKYKIGRFELQIKDDKIKIENGSKNLKSLLNDLIDRLKTAIIQTPAGPGNFSPADVQGLEQIKQGINQLLE